MAVHVAPTENTTNRKRAASEDSIDGAASEGSIDGAALKKKAVNEQNRQPAWADAAIKRIIFSEAEVAMRCRELAEELNRDYQGKRPLLLGMLNGVFMFMADLSRWLTVPHDVDFIKVSSYGMSTDKAGKVEIKTKPGQEVKGRDVILVDELVDTGRTFENVRVWLKDEAGATSVRTIAMVDKVSEHTVELKLDYCGFEAPDGKEWLVGYGMDVKEQYRSLPFIAAVHPFDPVAEQAPKQEDTAEGEATEDTAAPAGQDDR